MSSVDPFVVTWPSEWLDNNEIRPVITYLDRFLHDLWVRTGGGNDAIDDLQDSALGSDSRRISEIRQLTKKVKQLELDIQELNKCAPKPKKDIIEHPNYEQRFKRIQDKLNEIEVTLN